MTNLDLQKIKELRKGLKLTQPEMANKLSLNSGKLYHDREAGKVCFSADEAAKLALLFDVDLATLYNENFFTQIITQNVIERGMGRKVG